MKDEKVTFDYVMKKVSEFEERHGIYLSVNIDCDYYNICIMEDEWRVYGAYGSFKKPATKKGLRKALIETARELKRINHQETIPTIRGWL